MEKVLLLKDILSIGGKISFYKKGGHTNSIILSKFLKKNNISFDKEQYLVYLNYSNSPQIQAIYIVKDPKNGNSKLKEVYNKLNEL